MRRLFLVCCLLALPAIVRAQTAEDSVRIVVRRLFDGMRAGDSTMVLSVFHPQARMSTPMRNREGHYVLQTDGVAGFARAVGTPHPDVWDERVTDIEVRMDGAMATAWMPYHFYAGARFSHCGVNSIQLVRTDTGWKMLNLVDTRKRQGCTP